MNLLLLSTGRRVSLIKRLRKTAQKFDIPLKIYGTEIERKTPSLYFCDQFFMVPPTNSPDYAESILSILKNQEIHAVLPGNDLDLQFLCDLELPEALQRVKLLFSDRESTRTFLSKSRSAQFFQKIGLRIPEVFQSSKDVRYPAILKEDRGHGSRGQFLLKDLRDLEANYHKLEEPFLQSFVEGEEYTIDVFSDEDGLPVNILPRIREKVRSGISDVGRVEMDQDLLDLLTPRLKEFGLKGPWNLQCIHNHGEYFFLEVNPRFSGGIPLTIESGMNFCQNLLEWIEEKEITPFHAVEDGMVMMKYDSELFL